jgi:DNA repair and recombination protein RAD52
MALSAKQVSELEKPLDRSAVSSRKQSGRTLSYIEGWHAIAEANRIFGFDGWQRETIEMREVRPPELVKGQNGKETWRVGFIAKVRVRVGDIVREGTGYGSGALPELGEAYESAVKEAETDAMKRALMTFGNPFGLALYDKAQANVVDAEPANSEAPKKAQAKPPAAPAETYARLSAANANLGTLADFNKFWSQASVAAAFDTLGKDARQKLGDERADKAAELEEREALRDDAPPFDDRGYAPPDFDNMPMQAAE